MTDDNPCREAGPRADWREVSDRVSDEQLAWHRAQTNDWNPSFGWLQWKYARYVGKNPIGVTKVELKRGLAETYNRPDWR